MSTSNIPTADSEITDNPDTVNNEATDSAEVITNAFHQFKSYIDSRLENLNNVLQSRAGSAESEPLRSTKKLQRETEAQKLKYKSNSRQFVHNAEVQDHLLDVIEYLSNEHVDPSAALASAKDALAAVQKRQKLIKLADKSEAGWLAVEEYESDELADDSDDEKRIKKAQEKASRKKKQMGLARTKRQKVAPALSAYQARDQQLFRGNLFRPAFFVDSTCLLGPSQACNLCLLFCVM